MNLFKNTVLRVIVAIVLGILILTIASNIAGIFSALSPHITESFTWLSAALQSVSMLILSLLIIFLISKGNLSLFGFTTGQNVRYLRVIVVSVIASTIVIIVTSIIATLLQRLYPIAGEEHFASTYSFAEIVIFVWILASISEEVFVRGLLQGYLMPLKRYGFTLAKKYMSLPIVICALFFGAMHFMLLTTGMNIFMVGAVFVSTSVLGLIAGYYREQTTSLIPAIVAHVIFNIVGTVLSLLG